MSDLLTKYKDTIQNPPKDGEILRSIDGTPVALTVLTDEGKPPFIYGRAFVSEILDENLGWYLRSVHDEKSMGWKCILMTRARRDVIAKCGDTELAAGQLLVNALRVVRPSESGRSLLCEIAEYLCDGSSE